MEKMGSWERGRAGEVGALWKSREKAPPFMLRDLLPSGLTELPYHTPSCGQEDVRPSSQQPPGPSGQGDDDLRLRERILASSLAHCGILGLRDGASVFPLVK